MSTAERSLERARRRGRRILVQIGDEIRTARLMSGSSQHAVSAAARMSTSKVSRIEAARSIQLSRMDAVVLGDAAGLEISFKAYPGRRPTRDAAHAKRLHMVLSHVAKPLSFRTEVPLPQREGVREQRAWDALIFAPDGPTGVELEQRLYDVQAQTRRVHLKWRDSGVERLLLLIADTHANRRVVREFPDYFRRSARIKTATLYATLESGSRPPNGYALV